MTGAVRGCVGLAVALLLLVPSSVLRAQDADLDAVTALVENARFDDAREALQEWVEATPEVSRVDRQQSLWLRALLTIDPAMAELDYRRLVVEFPGGRFSDEALLRLAQLSRARGDESAAREYLEILVRDYPASPHRIEARSLLERPGGAARTLVAAESREGTSPPAATDPLPDRDLADREETAPESPAPPERSTAPEPAPAAPDPAAAAPEPVSTAPDRSPGADERASTSPDPAPTGSFAVQLGAFSDASGARTVAERARGTGLDVRLVLVEGSELVRVRLGAFPTRDGAEREARLVRDRGFDTVISSDRHRERAAP